VSAYETATLAGGCFWCLEAVFERLEGVRSVESGFAGGRPGHASYEEVCTGSTGHAEVVRVTFDPAVLAYADLLGFFFAFHDPTTPNRQGADVGSQYRSAIFFESEAQAATARAVIEALERERAFPARIVTEVAPLVNYVPAESYHQGYFASHAEQPYCRAVIAPKVAKLRAHYADRLKPEGATRGR